MDETSTSAMQLAQFTLRTRFLFIAAISAVLASTVWLVWNRLGREPRFRKAAEVEAQARLRRIGEEIASASDPQWSGKYYFGDGLGVNVSLSLAPKSGFVFEWHGCLGCYDRNYGTVSAERDLIRLRPRFSNRNVGFQGIADELVPVQWSDRRYLIAVDQLDDFCDAILNELEPRSTVHGWFLLAEGDHTKPTTGLALLPERFAPMLARFDSGNLANQERIQESLLSAPR